VHDLVGDQSGALLVLAHLLAVVDGSMQDKGTYPSSAGERACAATRAPASLIVAGAVAAAIGTVLSAVG
jgi:hypothetical protein